VTGFAGALLGGLGNLLDFFSGERRHRQALAQAAEHHREDRVSDAVTRFADHLRKTSFNAPVNRQFLKGLTDGFADSEKETVARDAFHQAPDVVSWFVDAGFDVERFLFRTGLRDED
jgi:hypothetical protein